MTLDRAQPAAVQSALRRPKTSLAAELRTERDTERERERGGEKSANQRGNTERTTVHYRTVLCHTVIPKYSNRIWSGG